MTLAPYFIFSDVPSFVHSVRSQKMFGGIGYFVGSNMFALVREGQLHLKAGSVNVADYLLSGQLPYIHACFGDYFPTNFYRVPDFVASDPLLLTQWMEKSITAAKSMQRLCVAKPNKDPALMQQLKSLNEIEGIPVS